MSILYAHRNKVFLSILFAVFVYAVLLLTADIGKLSGQVRTFDWQLVPVIVALTLFNYGVRFIKWHYYLALVGVRRVHWFDSLLIFLSGFSMTLTPGKTGEFLKSFLVRQRVGVPVATTAPIVLAERMTDGLALLFLAASGILLFDSPLVRLVMIGVLAAAVVVVLFVQRRELAERVLNWMHRAPLLAARMHHIRAFYISSYQLVTFKSLVIAIGLGMISWAGECLALALIVFGLGVPMSFELVFLSAFAMGFATLAGSLLLVPGGLGVAEASIDGLLLTFGRAPWLPAGTITQSIAAASTLMIRFATLWFGWGVGLVCLGIVTRRFGGSRDLGVEQTSVAMPEK